MENDIPFQLYRSMNPLKLIFAALFSLSLFVTGCGISETGEDKADPSIEQNENDPAESAGDNVAASTWEGHSLRAEPSAKGKWLASVTFGETMEILGESEKGEKHTYEKVRLSDGKEGWVRDDLIHKGGMMGAIAQTTDIYKRPSISNISDKEVKAATVIVIKQRKEEFTEFIAKNDKANNRARGWVLGATTVLTDEVDVAVAAQLSNAMAEANPVKRKKMFQKIVDNGRFRDSPLYELAEAKIANDEDAPEIGDDELMITGDNVNVRSAPNTETGEKRFQLNSGDIVSIVQKGEMDDIGGLNYWYEIKTDDGETGWVFGKFTHKAL